MPGVDLFQTIIDFTGIAKSLVGWTVKPCNAWVPALGDVILGAAYIAVCWLFLLFLYRKNVFLKV